MCIMKVFQLSIVICCLFFSCTSSTVKPKDVAQKACECQTLLEDLKAFSEDWYY